MERWIEVAREQEIPPGGGKTVIADGRSLALFNDGGEFFAVDDACPHQGASLGDGLLHDGRVICPLHSWVFELSSGRCPRDSHDPVSTYPARCREGSVEVCVDRSDVDRSDPNGGETA